VDRNEKQNSYKNTANTRGAGKQIKKLARTNKIMGGIIVVLLAIVCGLGIGYSRLNKEYKKTIQQNQENEQKNKAVAESETIASMETQSETEKISKSSEAQTEAETEAVTETEKGTETEKITETEPLTETESEVTTEAASGENDTESTSETEIDTETDTDEQLPISNWSKKSRLAKKKLEELLHREGIEAYYCIAPASAKNNVEILNEENSNEAVFDENVSNIDDLSQRENHPELSRLFVLGAFYQNMQNTYEDQSDESLQSLNKKMMGREEGNPEEAEKEEIDLIEKNNPDNKTGETVILEFMNTVEVSEKERTEIQSVSPEECIEFFRKLKAGTLIEDEKYPERGERMQEKIMLPSVNLDEFSDMNETVAQAEQDGNRISWAGENKDGYQYLVMLTDAGNGSALDENSYILYLKTKNENGNVKKLLEVVYQCMTESSRSEAAAVSEESTGTEASQAGSEDDTAEQETVLSEVQQ